MIDKYKTRKALVSIAIEKSLLKVGNPVYDLVITKLKEKYDCYLPDCYDHPEYLSEILSGLYERSDLKFGGCFFIFILLSLSSIHISR